MTLLYALLVGHFIADFALQNDWMALNKSKRWDALTAHVVVYSIAMAGFVIAAIGNAAHGGEWLLINAAAHFIQDAITSRWTSALWFVDGAHITNKARTNIVAYVGAIGEVSVSEALKAVHEELDRGAVVAYNDKRHWFFVVIGLDQLLHYVTLFVTAGWWLIPS